MKACQPLYTQPWEPRRAPSVHTGSASRPHNKVIKDVENTKKGLLRQLRQTHQCYCSYKGIRTLISDCLTGKLIKYHLSKGAACPSFGSLSFEGNVEVREVFHLRGARNGLQFPRSELAAGRGYLVL